MALTAKENSEIIVLKNNFSVTLYQEYLQNHQINRLVNGKEFLNLNLNNIPNKFHNITKKLVLASSISFILNNQNTYNMNNQEKIYMTLTNNYNTVFESLIDDYKYSLDNRLFIKNFIKGYKGINDKNFSFITELEQEISIYNRTISDAYNEGKEGGSIIGEIVGAAVGAVTAGGPSGGIAAAGGAAAGAGVGNIVGGIVGGVGAVIGEIAGTIVGSLE